VWLWWVVGVGGARRAVPGKALLMSRLIDRIRSSAACVSCNSPTRKTKGLVLRQ
jgi:hypothetical protein